MKRRVTELFTELFAVSLFSITGCTQFQLLNATVPTAGYLADRDLAYGTQARQTLDIYRPCATTQPTPVVVFFYGGDWQSGEKSDYRFVAQALTTKGFIAVLPDYRLYPQVQFPVFVEDSAKAVRWVHDHIALFGGDPSHVYLLGHSAGAQIVMLLTLDKHYLRDAGIDRSAIRAAAGLSGPYDFKPRAQEQAVFGLHSDSDSVPPAIEPIHFVDGTAPPILLIHGAKDDVVGPENAQRLFDKIDQAGGVARWIEYPDTGHVGTVLSFASWFRWLNPALCDVTKFFRAHA